ncbi:MAG: 50S ribosomal protein L29 [Thermoprotei archaeon]|nr:50S ribosomal protein L29 [Thermoprotei archaeon]
MRLAPKHKVRARDLRNMKPEEREKMLEEFTQELVKLKYQASISTLKTPGRLRELKRNVARILTVMGEEARGGK